MPSHITSGRCNECRRRKRKCDELRPSCSICARVGTPCTYPELTKFVLMYDTAPTSPDVTTGTLSSSSSSTSLSLPQTASDQAACASRHVELQVRRSKDTSTGTYHTFTTRSTTRQSKRVRARDRADGLEALGSALVKTPSPSESDRLACSFGSMIGLPGGYFWIWGNWSQYIPQRIGNSHLLDLAVAAMMATTRRLFDRTEKARKQAYLSYGKALKCLKDSIAVGRSAVNGEMIASMHLLQSCELGLDDTVHTWNAHVTAAVTCISALGPSWCRGEFERAMFYATYATTSTNLRLTGLHKTFDTPEWREVASAPSHHSASRYIKDENERRRRVVTIVPRLTSLVRQLADDPADENLAASIAHTLTEVIEIDRGEGPTAPPDDAELVPMPSTHAVPFIVKFTNPKDIVSYSYHWALRIAIYGICQQVSSWGLMIRGMPPLEEIADDEQKCAMYICASLPHLCAANLQIAAGAMYPLQMAWIGLWRASRRKGNSDDREDETFEEGYQDSTPVMDWLEGCIMRTAAVIGHEHSHEKLLAFADGLPGGPVTSSKDDVYEYGAA